MDVGEYLNNLVPSATIIIPAYNEERRIGRVLEEIVDFISINDLSWDVIVSIDGGDGTEQLVRSYSNDYKFIRYEKGRERGGKGHAIKRVIQDSVGDFTMLMDADGAVRFQDIIKGFHFCKEYDVILFDRYSNGENKIPLHRKIPSRAFNVLVRAMLGLKVKDTQCGYKLIRTELAKKAFNNVWISNTFFDVALLYHIMKMGSRIKEVDINYSHNDESRFNIIPEIMGQGISLFSFRLRHSRFYKYVPHWATELYLKKFRWI